jgi:hypothetical protein
MSNMIFRSWVARKVSSNVPIILKIAQTQTEVNVVTGVGAEMKKAKEIALKGANIFGMKDKKLPDNVMQKKEVFWLDGTEQIDEHGSIIEIGKVRMRTFWSTDGHSLSTKMEFVCENGPGSFIVSRTLESADLMVMILQIQLEKSTGPAVSIKRYFKKMKSTDNIQEHHK